eukprot:gene11252-3298_t
MKNKSSQTTQDHMQIDDDLGTELVEQSNASTKKLVQPDSRGQSSQPNQHIPAGQDCVLCGSALSTKSAHL